MKSQSTYYSFLGLSMSLMMLCACGGVEQAEETEEREANGKPRKVGMTPYKLGAFQFDSLNLLTTKFLNGDPIKRAQTEEDWKMAAENKEPAYCVCGEDSSVVLYNFYALSDPRGIVEQHRMLTMSDAKRMIEEQNAESYFPRTEPTIERSYSGKFYDLELINWWVIGENDSACVMCWEPDGSKLKLQPASKANGFCVRPITK